MKTALNITLIEDNPADARLIQEMLSESSYGVFRIEPVGSLKEGFDRIQRERPDVVLLDLALPDSNGLETLTDMQRSFPDLPVVVLTSSTGSDDVRRAYELGANSYLKKPATFESLQELVRTLDLYWIMLNVRPEHDSG